MNRDLAAIRAQRAEVDAWLDFRHAAEGPDAALAWWRLQQARRARLDLMGPEEVSRLPALPAPPPGALSRWQSLRLRLGWLRCEAAAPPRHLAQELAAGGPGGANGVRPVPPFH